MERERSKTLFVNSGGLNEDGVPVVGACPFAWAAAAMTAADREIWNTPTHILIGFATSGSRP